MSETWPAPMADGPVHGFVTVPGSKSATNRALVLAALADSPSTIRRPLRARDTQLMADALGSLGAHVAEGADESWVVTPGALTGGVTVDCGLAGTVMRFVPPVAALASGDVRVEGDPRAYERPMSALVDALRSLGVDIDDGGRGALPFTVRGTGDVKGGSVVVDASASSQLVSGLLLAAPRFAAGLELRHEGPPVPSQPHLEMTVQMLRESGANVDDSRADRWLVAPGPLKGVDRVVEPDLSNAAPFLAAAVATGGSVTVREWPQRTTQAGDALRDLLARMGAHVTLDDRGLTVSGDGRMTPLVADLHDVGELTPVLAALAALADGESRLTGIAHLRGHETDRIAALVAEIRGLGGDAEELPDGIALRPAALHGGTWHSYADHRMATAGAVLGLVVPGVVVEDIATTRKTLPDFPGQWAALVGG